jgi:hypothetical protein
MFCVLTLSSQGLNNQAPHCSAYARLPYAVAVSSADVTDRKGLETHTCERYGVVNKELSRLLSDVRGQ